MVKKAKFKTSPKKKKIPRYSSEIKKIKSPGYSPENNPDSILKLKPSWRFGLMDITGQWGWGNLESKEKLLKITEKLKDFETMTWEEIGKKGVSHPMPKDRLTRNAQKCLSGKRIDANHFDWHQFPLLTLLTSLTYFNGVLFYLPVPTFIAHQLLIK